MGLHYTNFEVTLFSLWKSGWGLHQQPAQATTHEQISQLPSNDFRSDYGTTPKPRHCEQRQNVTLCLRELQPCKVNDRSLWHWAPGDRVACCLAIITAIYISGRDRDEELFMLFCSILTCIIYTFQRWRSCVYTFRETVQKHLVAKWW